MLIIVMGLPGSGKTYFARAFAQEINAVHINTDMVRKELQPNPGYSALDKQEIYHAVFDRVCELLKERNHVVIDATFSSNEYRKSFYDYADKNHIPTYLIRVEADEETIAKRLQVDRPDSDADFTVYKKIKSEFAPLKREHLVLKSDKQSLAQMIKRGLEYTIAQ